MGHEQWGNDWSGGNDWNGQWGGHVGSLDPHYSRALAPLSVAPPKPTIAISDRFDALDDDKTTSVPITDFIVTRSRKLKSTRKMPKTKFKEDAHLQRFRHRRKISMRRSPMRSSFTSTTARTRTAGTQRSKCPIVLSTSTGHTTAMNLMAQNHGQKWLPVAGEGECKYAQQQHLQNHQAHHRYRHLRRGHLHH